MKINKKRNLDINESKLDSHNSKRRDFVYLKFNLSFLHKDCQKMDKNENSSFTKTIIKLSNRPWLAIQNENKDSGFEQIPLNQIASKMREPYTTTVCDTFEKNGRKLSKKRDVFRLDGTNKGRIIGQVVDYVFYVFYIDYKGIGYVH